MAKPFSSTDAKRIISEHKDILSKLKNIESIYKDYQGDVKKSADNMLHREIMKILEEIPVEEINRNKCGFRIKALKDYGYATMADIVSASIYNIASVRGISEDSAYLIKKAANKIAEQASKGVKVKLSTDNKTAAATELVTSILKFKKSKSLRETSTALVAYNERQIDYAVEDITSVNGFFSWIFASKEKKQKATEAYQYLQDLKNSDYYTTAQDTILNVNKLDSVDSSEAWDDFAKSTVSYFNVIENEAPGVLGNDDAVYGLPEDLAREIQDECFYPEGLLCELRRYQEWGVKYTLHQEKVLLGDEMGLGKTVQAIATMVSLRNTGATHFVVVCPASVITNWCREIRKHSTLRAIKIHGADRSSALKEWIKIGGVAVTTFETTGHFNLDNCFKFDLMVVDEAHYIKNPQAKRSINVRDLCSHTERLMFMTGTALENSVSEMIELIGILKPSIANKISQMASISSAPTFRDAVAPVYYRRRREDVLTELPDLIENREWCSLLPIEEATYEESILSKNFMESRRVSWNVDDLKNSSKARRLLEIVESAESEGRKVIVFSFFLDTIRKLYMFLGDRCMSPINGSISPERRQQIIDEFDKAPDGAVLLSQIQSGGTGLNIQSASVVILCEPQFKPSIENQAIARAYRMGQGRNVLVYRLLCENTIDEKLMNTLDEKQKIFNAFADKSVAANESAELDKFIDDKKFGKMIEEEIERINIKRGADKSIE